MRNKSLTNLQDPINLWFYTIFKSSILLQNPHLFRGGWGVGRGDTIAVYVSREMPQQSTGQRVI